MRQSEKSLTVQQIAVRLREDINEFLPNGIEMSVCTSQEIGGTLVTVTITRWPDTIPMLSRAHIFDERRAILTGLKSEMSKDHHLSDEANLLVAQVQSLLNHYQVTEDQERNFIGEVAFDKRSLNVERDRVLQSLKQASSSGRQGNLFSIG